MLAPRETPLAPIGGRSSRHRCFLDSSALHTNQITNGTLIPRISCIDDLGMQQPHTHTHTLSLSLSLSAFSGILELKHNFIIGVDLFHQLVPMPDTRPAFDANNLGSSHEPLPPLRDECLSSCSLNGCRPRESAGLIFETSGGQNGARPS